MPIAGAAHESDADDDDAVIVHQGDVGDGDITNLLDSDGPGDW